METLTTNQQTTTSANLTSTMKAAVFAAPGQIEIREVAMPEPKSGEVRVRLEGCGVCASNIPVYEGREWFSYPMEAGNPGHEAWGIVDKTGEGVTQFKKGDRVAMLSYRAYAQYDIAPVSQVVKLPGTLADLPFPGEPLGCTINIFKRCDIKPGSTVAVVGVGFLGALLIQLIKQAGARVIAISRRDYSLEVAKQCGADEVIPMHDHWQIIDRVKQLTDGRLCDRVIEAIGNQWAIDLSGELVRERGKLIIAGYHQEGLRQVNMQMWNWKGMDVINAHERDPEVYVQGIREAVQAVAEGKLKPSGLYTNFFDLENINSAFETLQARPDGFMKAIIRM